MSESEVLCFHCAQPIGDPPQLNELEEGEVCPVCRDRLLEELPSIMHSPVPIGGAASRPGGGMHIVTGPDDGVDGSVEESASGAAEEQGTESSADAHLELVADAEFEAELEAESEFERAPWPRLLRDEPEGDAGERDEAESADQG